jgi:hypothetical protein
MNSAEAMSAVTATIWPGWTFAPVPTARSASFWRRSGSMTGGYTRLFRAVFRAVRAGL